VIRVRCAMLALSVSAGALMPTLGPADASAQGSPYVPLDDIVYRYADALIARGALRNVSLLERPYRASALSAGADTVLMRSKSGVLRSYALAMQTALARYGEGTMRATFDEEEEIGPPPRLFVNGDLFATAQSSGIRELTQADAQNSVTAGVGLRVGFTAYAFVGMFHPTIDNRLNNDPQFGGRRDRAIAGRTEDAYVSGQWEYAQLFLGRMGRNWGPFASTGLMLGNYAYSYDHLYARFGSNRLHISSVAAKLDDDFQPDGVYARYFYTHRLGWSWRGIEVGISESYLATGVGRSYDLSLINPLNLYALSWRNERDDGNLSIGGDFAVRTTRFGTFAGELFLDDLQIDECDSLCNEPSSYGITLTAEGMPLHREHRLFASYTRLTGLAYRTPKPSERYASFGVGLGRGFTDYDEARLGVDIAAIPYATLRVYGAYRRQGEGDFHLPFPAASAYASTRGFLMGTVARTARAAVTTAIMVAPGVEITGDGGYNRTTNTGHVAGATRSAFEGRVRLQWTPRGWFGAL
jgi:hypothetical protein